MAYVRRQVLGLAAACALLAACGGSRDRARDHQAVEALRTAQAKVAAAGSAHVEATMDTGDRLASHSAGALSWSDGVEGTLTVRITGGELAASTRKLGGDPSQTRFLPDAYYTRMTDVFAAGQRGRHWIRYPYDAGSDLTPADTLKALVAAQDVRRVGVEAVGATRASHYRGTSGSQRIDVWIDARHLMVRRVQRAGDFTSTVHYRDYGTPAAAERPAAHDTVDFADVTQNASRDASKSG
ncbi:hypothetical protein G3I40_38795 [Streptomyces sp. SID14478]|uniref:hypothetical protein n=1 Tax=Streptomyces sp. SID14478 TaxID=2706073 RepID=UPI0013E0C9A2|nr:hypothetical protein [Streptomyces sp. SID14478]NEB81115.1 hypothetical protein [Streptomyces sp. SID14478]